ncbi:distal membrane-arm assembly complex protein 2 [Cephus cinctus]|uniref:Distal membrane-arm assembly complex protein 2 n=1 Tax=Cephus cinctus TaxID=211228 RepID=A0AAJ7FUU8_CEPCN|nr:distal membrane-arm assembly complex protein 2 [Cephus cinctus]
MFSRKSNIILRCTPLCIKHGNVQYVLRKKTYSDEAKTKKLKTLPPKNWFKPPPPNQGSMTSLFLGNAEPNVELIKWASTPIKFGIKDVKNWYKKTSEKFEDEQQQFIQERHEILGSNLAIAHFIVHRGGKIMLRGDTAWIQKDENDVVKLPRRFDPKYVVTMIDASGMNLRYNGLMNFCNLGSLKWVSFKGCEHLDDWCLDRITALLTTVEYLDISNCKKITHRGLVAIYKMPHLKKLLVTNYDMSDEFELTCLMLEELNSNLQCEILEPQDSSTSDSSKIDN